MSADWLSRSNFRVPELCCEHSLTGWSSVLKVSVELEYTVGKQRKRSTVNNHQYTLPQGAQVEGKTKENKGLGERDVIGRNNSAAVEIGSKQLDMVIPAATYSQIWPQRRRAGSVQVDPPKDLPLADHVQLDASDAAPPTFDNKWTLFCSRGSYGQSYGSLSSLMLLVASIPKIVATLGPRGAFAAC